MTARKAVANAISGVAEQINPDSLTHSALMPLYEQILGLIDRYSTDPEIDAVVAKVRGALGIKPPERTYEQPDQPLNEDPNP